MTAVAIVAAIALLLANGFFVAGEFAVIASRVSKLEQRAREGNTLARTALKSARELSFMLSAAQLGITMASLGLGWVAEPAVAHLLRSGLRSVTAIPAAIAHSVSFVVALVIITFLHMVLSEMAPKNIAIADPERAALWIAIPFRFYANTFRPFITVFNKMANAGTRLLGVEPTDERPDVHSAGEIGAMIRESAKEGLMEDFEHRLLSGAIDFGAKDAGAIMIPRTDVVAIPAMATPADVDEVVLETGHSRFPVYGGDLDKVFGFLHIKDMLQVEPGERERPISRQFIRRMLVVPESRKLHPVLFDMRRERTHFGLVVDEHGGTAGIVTLEDLLEELVGEIQDEHDAGEVGIRTLGEHRHLIPGNIRIDEVAAYLGIDLPEGEYETVAGWLMDRLGRIPKRRDAVDHDGWSFRVRRMQRRRVEEVLVEAAAHPPSELDAVGVVKKPSASPPR
ncbi:MAG: HlyC/CorC family transporter [Actinobacteria bacterium]|nr:HlyC/CorC family transporter [Actinomycetota bacterium]